MCFRISIIHRQSTKSWSEVENDLEELKSKESRAKKYLNNELVKNITSDLVEEEIKECRFIKDNLTQ